MFVNNLRFSFSGPPSAPASLSWEYESSEGGVSLRWRPPVNMGGRSEVWYGVVCRICPSATDTPPSMCSWCGDTVTFSPSQTGLKQTRVTLKNLLTRVTYLIQVITYRHFVHIDPEFLCGITLYNNRIYTLSTLSCLKYKKNISKCPFVGSNLV